MKKFMDEDFLLQTGTAKKLYHEYAEKMPIFDYHCHIPPRNIAENTQFENITQIWLYGDHYKWRAMRSMVCMKGIVQAMHLIGKNLKSGQKPYPIL